jgi:uncharacterized protein (TIGR03435 family)
VIRSIFVVTLLSCCIALGQSPTAPAAPVAFDVAAIHPHQGPLHTIMGFSSSGPRLRLEGYNQIQLVMEAYNLKPYQVSMPKTGQQGDVYYDIVAVAEGEAAPTKDEFRRMLQTLLAQRFNLKFHLETREMPVYALVVGKNGTKFNKSASGASDSGLIGVHGRNQTIAVPRESMESLADNIPNVFMVDRPVVDRTSLTGTYDINLEATPEFRIRRDPQPDDLSVFTAVQEQLGLKLEPTNAAVPVMVIDHIEKPSDN